MERRASLLLRPERWLPAAIAAISLALWETAARASWISALFFPPPTQILLTLARMSGSAEFWAALGMTCLRLASGVAIGCGAGLVLGWVMGANRAVRVAVDPIVAALHPLPKLAIFPIFLVLLGIGEASKVALLATVAFFPMVINTLAGVRQIDRAHWEAAANYGATGRTLLRRVIVPGSLPMALVGLRLAVNTALVVAIAVEMLSAQEGLGARIWLAWQTLRVQELYAILAVIALLGWVLHWLLATAAIRLAPWHGDARLDS